MSTYLDFLISAACSSSLKKGHQEVKIVVNEIFLKKWSILKLSIFVQFFEVLTGVSCGRLQKFRKSRRSQNFPFDVTLTKFSWGRDKKFETSKLSQNRHYFTMRLFRRGRHLKFRKLRKIEKMQPFNVTWVWFFVRNVTRRQFSWGALKMFV